MDETETLEDAPVSNLPRVARDFNERAEKAGWAPQLERARGIGAAEDSIYFIVALPNGRVPRRVMVDADEIEDLLEFDFESWIALGDYQALVDSKSGKIEAQVTTGAGPIGRSSYALSTIPGVEHLESDPATEDDTDPQVDEISPPRSPRGRDWRLRLERDGVTLELSPASPNFRALFRGRGATLKIEGVRTSSHDTALEALERLAGGLLFDLDLVYGIVAQLSKRRRVNRPRRRNRPDKSPVFPRNQYASQALELYQYGRAAAGLPLLEYLANYQSIEYFFPYFAREQAVHLVRAQLLHPGFDATDDVALSRLINAAAPAGRTGMTERDQLRATVRASVNEADLDEFFVELADYVNHFSSKKQPIKAVGQITLSGNRPDLRDQVADRIYAIRCRIVHAKQDGGVRDQEVLLPASAEADSLQPDIELVRFIAQRALVARAARG